MLKIFVTGDNHIGKSYNRYPEIQEFLIKSRKNAFYDMVKDAEKEGCGLFVITGDLFDNVNTIKKSDVKEVVNILSNFSGTVLILPGNHDYYTGKEKVWEYFKEENTSTNMILLNKKTEYKLNISGESVSVYPAFCNKKHSKENQLSWIKELDITGNDNYLIGIAHGAIQGITPDMREEYFLMETNELMNIPVDVWLVGHTHIQFPGDLKTNEDIEGYKIFNAGTHEQTDLHNNTEGACFVITLDKIGGKTKVLAHKYLSGKVRFYDLELDFNGKEDKVESKLNNLLSGIDNNSVVRVSFSGRVSEDDYKNLPKICKRVLGEFLSYEINYSRLSEEITLERIRGEYAETSFAAKFIEMLIDNPTETTMAYELLKECEEKEHET